MSKKVWASVLTTMLYLLYVSPANAEFRGSDMWSNLVPAAGNGGLADRYPISYYALDYHVEVGITDPDGTPALIAQWFASQAFSLMAMAMRMFISVFDWAFTADLLTGSKGAINPVEQAAQGLYGTSIKPLLATAVLVLGAWVTAKILGRKFGEAGLGVVRALALTTACMVIIFNAGGTIGTAMSLSNALSSAIVSSSTGGNGSTDVSDRLFDTFVYKPWVVLQFGGLERCTGSKTDDDGFPLAVGVDDPRAKVCHNAAKKYAPRFVKLPPGSDQRKAEFEVLNTGSVPASTLCDKGANCIDGNQFEGYKVDKTDAVAVDMMQEGGAFQRLTFVVVLATGIIGAILLLGLISCAALFVQLGLLVMIGVAPGVLIVSIFPGAHGLFWSWASGIGKLIIAKVVLALLLSAAVGTSAAIMAAGDVLGGMGYLGAFILQSVLFLGLFIKRKSIVSKITSKSDYSRSENKVKSFVGSAATTAVTATASPLAAAGKFGHDNLTRQQPAAKPNSAQQTASTPNGSTPDSTSPPASAGREEPAAGNTSSTVATIPSSTGKEQPAQPVDQGEQMPTKPFNQEYQSYKDERKQGEPPKPPIAPPTPVVNGNGSASASSFREHLENDALAHEAPVADRQQHAKTPGQ